MSAFVTAPLVPRRARSTVNVLSRSRPNEAIPRRCLKSSRMLADRGAPRAEPLAGLLGLQRDPGAFRRVDISRPAPNKRIVTSNIVVAAPIGVVWDVLSAYERLAEYIPNLAMSKRLPHPKPTGIRLEQCGVQSILGFEFRASVVIDMLEVNKESSVSRAIDFELVQSRDFQEFSGHWRMESLPNFRTALFYRVSIIPKGLVPVKAIEWRISEDVPQNMDAVKRQCELRQRAAANAAWRAQSNGTS